MNGYGFDSASQFFGESSFDSNGFDTNGFSNTEDNSFGFDSTSDMYGESFGNYSSDDFGSSFSESAFDENGFSTDEMISESDRGFTMRAEDYEKLQKHGKEVYDSLFGDVMGSTLDDYYKKHPEKKRQKPMTDEEYRRHRSGILSELGGESSKSKKKTDSSGGMSEDEIAKSRKKLFESEPMTDDEISKSKKKLGFEFFTDDYQSDEMFVEGTYKSNLNSENIKNLRGEKIEDDTGWYYYPIKHPGYYRDKYKKTTKLGKLEKQREESNDKAWRHHRLGFDDLAAAEHTHTKQIDDEIEEEKKRGRESFNQLMKHPPVYGKEKGLKGLFRKKKKTEIGPDWAENKDEE